MLSIIAAFDDSRGIGLADGLPWSIPEDLRLFKKRTLNHRLIMGSKTFFSLPGPLNNRQLWVITRRKLENYDNVTFVSNFSKLLKEQQTSTEEIFVCGGAEIYRQALPYCQKMYISHIKKQYPVDTYFPEYDKEEWETISSCDYQDFVFYEYQRRE